MDVSETLLPGLGIRYEFVTVSGTRVGLIARRDGQVDVVVYDAEDPDICTEVMALTPAEADTLAELLGAPRIAERFADLTREIPGLVAAQLEVPEGSRYAGRALGETRARTLTGASIVAVVRDQDVVASPPPTQQLRAGDVLVVVGTAEALPGSGGSSSSPTASGSGGAVQADPAFLVELGVLLLLLGAAGAVAWRIGLSAVPLFLLAGLLVGEGRAGSRAVRGAVPSGRASIGSSC